MQIKKCFCKTKWQAPDIKLLTDEVLMQRLEYGKDLISHTAKYLGPNANVKQISNGMICSNCYIDTGTKLWGNNYGSVFSTYLKMRARSGQIKGGYNRINDCLERSLNVSHLNEEDKEMKAIIAYIGYIGKDVTKVEEATASGIYNLEFLDRAADPSKGKPIYDAKCASCHQVDGQRVVAADKKNYLSATLGCQFQ